MSMEHARHALDTAGMVIRVHNDQRLGRAEAWGWLVLAGGDVPGLPALRQELFILALSVPTPRERNAVLAMVHALAAVEQRDNDKACERCMRDATLCAELAKR